MPNANSVIGLDIGHSAVKIACYSQDEKERHLLFPSIAVPAFSISDDGEARRAARETVMVGSRAYFFGETARTQGGTLVCVAILKVDIADIQAAPPSSSDT